jgi:hypothetical protein
MSKKPGTSDYLAGFTAPAAKGAKRSKPRSEEKSPPQAVPKAAKPEKATFMLPPELMAELRAASQAIPPNAFGASLSGLVERAIAHELEALRRKWNDGEPFKASGQVVVRKGRPPKT